VAVGAIALGAARRQPGVAVTGLLLGALEVRRKMKTLQNNRQRAQSEQAAYVSDLAQKAPSPDVSQPQPPASSNASGQTSALATLAGRYVQRREAETSPVVIGAEEYLRQFLRDEFNLS
jgi:hypothetical protein